MSGTANGHVANQVAAQATDRLGEPIDCGSTLEGYLVKGDSEVDRMAVSDTSQVRREDSRMRRTGEMQKTLLRLLRVSALVLGVLEFMTWSLCESVILRLLGSIAICLTGAAILVLHRHRPIPSEMPHCPCCGYMLIDESERCPECGKRSHKKDRPLYTLHVSARCIAVGLAMLTLGSMLALYTLRSVDWISTSPSGVLVWMLHRVPVSKQDSIARELLARWNGLDDPVKSRAIGACMDIARGYKAGTANDVYWLLSKAIDESRVEPEQIRQLCESFVHGEASLTRASWETPGELQIQLSFFDPFSIRNQLEDNPRVLWLTVEKVAIGRDHEWSKIDWHPMIGGAAQSSAARHLGLDQDIHAKIEKVELGYSVFHGVLGDRGGSTHIGDGLLEIALSMQEEDATGSPTGRRPTTTTAPTGGERDEGGEAVSEAN